MPFIKITIEVLIDTEQTVYPKEPSEQGERLRLWMRAKYEAEQAKLQPGNWLKSTPHRWINIKSEVLE